MIYTTPAGPSPFGKPVPPAILDFNQAGTEPKATECRTSGDRSDNAGTFREAMRASGIEPPEEIHADGKLHRFTVSGDRPRSDNGWYVLYTDELPAGAFGCWKRNVSETWCGKAADTLTPEEKARHRKALEALKQQRAEDEAQRQAKCRRTAAKIWENATEEGADRNPYAVRKGIKPYGARTSDRDNLIIPVFDVTGELHGLQFINPTKDAETGRDKNFLTATAKRGNFCFIGELDGAASLIVCEGWATGCSLHEATGLPVVVAFDSGNLKPVAEVWRQRLPDTHMVIAADDDHAQEGNPGQAKAAEAAQAVGAIVISPSFHDPLNRGTDFNDLHQVEGLDTVRAQIRALVKGDAATEPLEKSRFISLADLLKEPITVEYLIHRLIERNTTGALFGPSGEGKSFVAFDWALSIVTGGTVNGQKTRQGLIVYLAGEGRTGLLRRAEAWRRHNNKAADDFARFHLSRGTIGFDGSGLEGTLAELTALQSHHSTPVVMIVIDTLARHIEGDENSTHDMGAFVKSVDALRNAFPGSVAMVVHHTGLSADAKGRMRGNSALKGALDFEILCDKGLLTFTKVKDGPTPDPIPFKLRPVNVGTDEEGQPVTSCVVEYGERSEQHQETLLNANEKLALKALVKAAVASVKQEDGKWGALIGDWRQAFRDLRYAEEPTAKLHTIDVAFGRVTKSLAAKGLVKANGHFNILTQQSHQEEVIQAKTFDSLFP